ncbi:hypothetical protein DIPPA_34683 [Diplonema papillatum]|nr:hypothetical protein DIPPA_34683 [Diplonema papillatum]
MASEEPRLLPGARMQMSHNPSTPVGRLVRVSFKLALVYTVAYTWYNRKTIMEGGVFSRAKMNFLTQDRRLVDWYFHLIGKKRPGYIIDFQYQMEIPIDQQVDADELLTEFARELMGSWVRTWEAHQRALDEPRDRFSTEMLRSCEFRPPTGFNLDEEVAHRQQQLDEAKAPPAGWLGSWFGAKRAAPAAGGAPPSGEGEQFEGDVIGGYGVHRRAGIMRSNMRRVLGGSSADMISARSMVLAPDPWEERGYVLSVAPARGYATLRLHYATSATSLYLPDATNWGFLARRYEMHRNRWLLSSAGHRLEQVYKAKAEERAAMEKAKTLESVEAAKAKAAAALSSA